MSLEACGTSACSASRQRFPPNMPPILSWPDSIPIHWGSVEKKNMCPMISVSPPPVLWNALLCLVSLALVCWCKGDMGPWLANQKPFHQVWP